MMDDSFLKELQELFLVDAEALLLEVESLFLALEKEDSNKKEIFDQIKRLAHNFKGGGKTAGYDGLARFSHCLENLLVGLSSGFIILTPEIIQLLLESNDALKQDVAQLRQNPKGQVEHLDLEKRLNEALESSVSFSKNEEERINRGVVISPFVAPIKKTVKSLTAAETKTPTPVVVRDQDEFIRVPMKRIDELLNSFGEQVIFLSALDHYKEDLEKYRDEIYRTIFNLKKLALDLQQSTMTLRMVNIKTLFSKLERTIRDAAKSVGKKVVCEISGAEQELDKGLVDQLSDPLIHMVRNAVDHGLEDSLQRIEKGKSDVGRVSLLARREGGNFVIEVRDDGKGLNPDAIKEKAIEKGLISSADNLSEKEIFDLIFENGFSTKEQVSELSGRGVGMNVVKEMIYALKGSCEIESKLGHGTCFKIQLPLSLSLFNGLLVYINGDRFIVPSSQVMEIIDPRSVECRDLTGGRKILQLRDSVLDLIALPTLLKARRSGIVGNVKEMILISEIDGRKIGFLIHRIIGIQRVVQKPLTPEMSICPGAAGVTILGDGSPAMILDLRELIERRAS